MGRLGVACCSTTSPHRGTRSDVLAGCSVDHLDAPKPSGYRAHHLILRERERGLLVEHVGDRSGHRLKHGEGSERLLELLRVIADPFAALDTAAPGGPSVRSSGVYVG